jgi:hypothetical protein
VVLHDWALTGSKGVALGPAKTDPHGEVAMFGGIINLPNNTFRMFRWTAPLSHQAEHVSNNRRPNLPRQGPR